MAQKSDYSGWLSFDLLQESIITPGVIKSLTETILGGTKGIIETVEVDFPAHLTLLTLGYKVTAKTLEVLRNHRDAILQTYTAQLGEIMPLSEQYIVIRVIQNEIAELSQTLLLELKDVGEDPIQKVDENSPFGYLGHISLVRYDTKENRDEAMKKVHNPTVFKGIFIRVGNCKLKESQPDGSSKLIDI